MVHYVHIIGRQHGVTSEETDDQIGRLEETIKRALPEGSKWHGLYYRQVRKRANPSWLRKEIIFAFAGHRGLNRLNEIWCQTWVFLVNLKIEGDFGKGVLRTFLGLHMTVERMECTDGRRLDAVTNCMLHVRDEIPWSEDREARKEDSKGRRCYGKWFEIGRHI